MMRPGIPSIALALALAAPALQAQDQKPDEALVQKLLKDPKALTDALAHCDPAAMTEDRDCLAGQEARHRQFFGDGSVPYTPRNVEIFGKDKPLNPPPPPPGSGSHE